MRLNAIISGCASPFWIDVFKRLHEDAVLDPVYWIAVGLPQLNTEFPHCIVHDTLHAVRGIPVVSRRHRSATVDAPLLDRLARDESIIFSMMDRMDSGNAFSYRERMRLYHTYIGYWQSVLADMRPDIVIFSETPHMGYDYVLYRLCQINGLRTLSFGAVGRLGMLLAMERFEDGFQELFAVYRRRLALDDDRPVVLSPHVAAQLEQIRGAYDDAKPEFMKLIDQRNQPIADPTGDDAKTIALAARRVRIAVYEAVKRRVQMLQRWFRPAPGNYLKWPGKTIEDPRQPSLGWYWHKAKANRFKHKLAKYYDEISQPADLDRPFIFVALHYQPEKTTSPEGGRFVNQLLMVDLLSKLLPEGWVLYVKEHRVQFMTRSSHGERSRDFWFYDDLRGYRNVVLVPLDAQPFDLIDNARAVATVNGTTGWEAVVRGKPVLVFGYPWYEGCHGVFAARDAESCRSALTQIEQGVEVPFRSVQLFAKVLEERCVPGYTNRWLKGSAPISEQENIGNITAAIKDYCVSTTATTPTDDPLNCDRRQDD